ncbi:acyl--binding protein [Plasmopara halstedii]|uniref:Acyl--binding protein n=1 Tax=Plasmopara halstedii TaxID=4781 RepID=A0A0P1AUB7_PLAHL|nr:acyl--binding protein [Plasmopara halstedii]CEG44908.1 acyl--binding protein [Plasmopara halstedii]|eukprot:XP_024581277.1 acyl--binding protein [Plasmopara halstedii]
MSDLKANFEAAAEAVKTLTSLKNDEKLAVYSLYKQATVGDNTTAAPGMFDMRGKAKWEAWNTKKDMSSEDAMKAYIAEVEKLKSAYAYT